MEKKKSTMETANSGSTRMALSQCSHVYSVNQFSDHVALTNQLYLLSYIQLPKCRQEMHKPLNEGKRLPRQYCAILSRFRPASVNRSQAAVE